MKITDFKLKFKDIDSAMNAAKMFELRKQVSISILDGKFRDARKYQKELAANAIADYETYKRLPFIKYTMPVRNSLKDVIGMAFNSFKFNIFSKFCKKTPDEKQLYKLNKEYFSKFTKEDIKKNTIDITIPALF